MARYILIDNYTGYIFGDTANLPSHTFEGTKFPVGLGSSLEDIARWLDETECKEFGRVYELKIRPNSSNECGYHIYRAAVNGSEAVGNIIDGQNAEMIAAVERDCHYEGFVSAWRLGE